jgi:hypothetical protein
MNQLTDTLLDAIRRRLIATVLELQLHTATAANVIPIPGTERSIAIGTAAEVASLLNDERVDAKPGADFATWLDQHPELRGFTIGAKGHQVWRAARAADARPVLSELFAVATKYKAAIESDTLNDQNEEDLAEALADAELWLMQNVGARASAAPAALAQALQPVAPTFWYDPSAIKRTRLTNYADQIEITATSIKFGHATSPLYAAPTIPKSLAKLLLRLREDGVLSEGQITQALETDRLTCREILEGGES